MGGLIIGCQKGDIVRISIEAGRITSEPVEQGNLVPDGVIVSRVAGRRSVRSCRIEVFGVSTWAGCIRVGEEACSNATFRCEAEAG